MKLRHILFLLILFCISGGAVAKTTYTKPYFKSNGTYVGGHYKTAPNKTKLDNWSTKGNVNPYTGKKGYTNPYPSYSTKPKCFWYNGKYVCK